MFSNGAARVWAGDDLDRDLHYFDGAPRLKEVPFAWCVRVLDTSDRVRSGARAAADVAMESLGFDHVGG